MGYNIHEHKRYYYTFDNSLLLIREHLNTRQPKSFHANHNVRFLPCQHWGVGIMQYVRAKPCVHRFNYSRTPQEKFPVRLKIVIREYNDDSYRT